MPAGFVLHVTPGASADGEAIDVGLPYAADGAGFEAAVSGLDSAHTYRFEVAAYGTDGYVGPLSNALHLDYRDAAAMADSDHDGLTDAEEDRNFNRRRDPGETDRLVADTDGDFVPDGVEVAHGSDPLSPASPACWPLDIRDWTLARSATLRHDPQLDDAVVVRERSPGRSRLAGYPARGRAALAAPLLVTRVRAIGWFRVTLRVRTEDGRRFRLRYESPGNGTRIGARRLDVSLTDGFGPDTYTALGFDVATDLTRIDPAATRGRVEHITVSGNVAFTSLRACY